MRTCPCIMALSSTSTAWRASGGCSGCIISSTAFHKASTAFWNTHTTHFTSTYLHIQAQEHTAAPPRSHLLKLLGFGEVTHVVDDFDPVVEATFRSELLNDGIRENIWETQDHGEVQCSVGASLTIRMSSVMINSDGLFSVCLLWGRGVPRPKIPFTLSRRDSLLGCLFIFTPVTDPERENERYLVWSLSQKTPSNNLTHMIYDMSFPVHYWEWQYITNLQHK